MEKIKVLIADDLPAFRDSLGRLLKEETDLEVPSINGYAWMIQCIGKENE